MSDPHVGHRTEHAQAESRTAIPPATRVSFSLVLRYPVVKQRALDDEAARLLAGARPATTREAAASARAADPRDLDRVRSFCEKSGLTIDGIHADSRTIHVSGDAATVNALFHIVLIDARAGSTEWREYDGELRIPGELKPAIEAVLGLSTKPLA
jgi:hypothetical protein